MKQSLTQLKPYTRQDITLLGIGRQTPVSVSCLL